MIYNNDNDKMELRIINNHVPFQQVMENVIRIPI